jgi:hypothetical protein
MKKINLVVWDRVVDQRERASLVLRVVREASLKGGTELRTK